MTEEEIVTTPLEKVFEIQVKCPLCGNNAKLEDYRYNVPYYNDILISILKCSACGYVFRDVFVLSGKGPRKITYRVEKPGDENAIVVRSAYAKIEIPELGLVVEPGTLSQGYMTTVEGIILDFIDVLESLCKGGEVQPEKCEEVRKQLEKARNGEIQFTVIIYDYFGASDIISEKTVYEALE